MISDIDSSKNFSYWWDEGKWSGVINIKWNQIKDLHYDNFQHIKEGDKCVTALKDGSRVNFKNGIEMLKVFQKAKQPTSTFDDFPYMDQREEHLRMERDLTSMMQKTYSQMMGGAPVETNAGSGSNRRDNQGGNRKNFRNRRRGAPGDRGDRGGDRGDRGDREVYYKKKNDSVRDKEPRAEKTQ